ncbi:MAG: hypothetical protein D6737_20060 [Chloroflexi bacterium]|nr:MAG: hypothetical protein D6737_20060 [Chloroflexota bacterium]
MTTFDPQTTFDDFIEMTAIVEHFWRHIPPNVWEMRTGTRDKDWTLWETLAHLVAIAEMFNRAIEHALTGSKRLHIDGFVHRTDLRAWNEAEIAAREYFSANELLMLLLTALEEAAEYAQSLTPQEANLMIAIPAYNRAFRVLDYIDFQLSHVGVIHGAQVSRPIDNQPLWRRCSPGLLQRQVDRYIRQMSAAYWPDVGGDLVAPINFYIDGESGGEWHIIAAPDGGSAGAGVVDDPFLTIRFAEPDVLFGVFTVHLSFTDALTSGQMRIDDDGRQAAHILRLFSASPPK